MPRRSQVVVAVAAALALIPVARAAELSPDLRDALEQGAAGASVVVRTEPGVPPGPRLRTLAADPAARAFPRLGMLALPLAAAEIRGLLEDPAVASVSVDHEVRALARRSRPAVSSGRRPRVGVSGSGVGIAIVDTGVGAVDGPRPVRSVGFVRRQGTEDLHGHGTFLAGVIREMAPRARLVSLRALDERGRGRASDVLAAVEWLLEHGERHDVRVALLAFAGDAAGPCRTDPLCGATRALRRAGIVPVAAAGAAHRDGIASPGRSPHALAVGGAIDRGTAHRGDDAVADDSPRGALRRTARPKPDLVAHLDRGGYRGTSIAAAEVSAVAALLADAAPSLDADEMVAILLYTCQTLDGSDAFAQGAGLVNAEGAVRLARSLQVARSAGRTGLARERMPNPFSEIDGELVPWSAGHVVVPGTVFTTRYRPSRDGLDGEIAREPAPVLAGGAVEVGTVRIARSIGTLPGPRAGRGVRYTTPEGRPIGVSRTPANTGDPGQDNPVAARDAADVPGRVPSVAGVSQAAPYSQNGDIGAPRARTGSK